MNKYSFSGVGMKAIAATGFVACAILATTAPGHAARGDVDLYQITIKKIELCTDKYCTDSSVISSDQQDLDIASASAGSDAGSLASSKKPTAGTTYNFIGITMSRTFQIRGVSKDSDCVTKTAGAIGTKADGTSGTNNIAAAATINEYIHTSAVYGSDVGLEANWGDLVNASALTWVGGSENTAADARIVYPLSAAYTATADAPTITVSIDTQDTVYDSTGTCNGGTGTATLHIVDPAVSVSVQ